MRRQFLNGIQNDGELSGPFLTNGIKQGFVIWHQHCVASIISAMLTDAFQECDTGFQIMYHFDGKLYNLRRLQAKTKVQTDVLDELMTWINRNIFKKIIVED